jgi:hypothetical protein
MGVFLNAFPRPDQRVAVWSEEGSGALDRCLWYDDEVQLSS